eukprot:3219957-Pleurochrysis_carterae.AAC.1
MWLVGLAFRATFKAFRALATPDPSLTAQAASGNRLFSDFTPFESALDASLRAALDLFVRARLLSLLFTLILASVYAYLAVGARLLKLQHDGVACSLPSRVEATIPWFAIVQCASHCLWQSCGHALRLCHILLCFDANVHDAVEPALCTLIDPLSLFVLVLRAFSRVGVAPRGSAPNATRDAMLTSASAVSSVSPPQTPRAHSHTVVPGPRSSARALLAGRPRRVANSHARGTGQRGVTFVVDSGCTWH